MSRDLQVFEARKSYVTYNTNRQEFVTMRVGEQRFGLSVASVQDVLRKQKIAKIPLAPQEVAGLLNLRGRVVTAIDVRTRLGLPPMPEPDKVMNVVVEYKGELFSLMVDAVGEVLSLPMNEFEKSPTNLNPTWKNVALGVFKLQGELLVILDVSHLLQLKLT